MSSLTQSALPPALPRDLITNGVGYPEEHFIRGVCTAIPLKANKWYRQILFQKYYILIVGHLSDRDKQKEKKLKSSGDSITHRKHCLHIR